MIHGFLSLATTWLAAEGVTPADIRAGKLVPGSNSPDRNYCMLEVFHHGTTQNSVIFSNADHTANLGQAPLATVWSTDIPYPKRAAIIWSPDSTWVAIHDTLNKHSVLSIYGRGKLEFAPLTMPDLLAEACRIWSVDRAELVSSGQRPLRWDANDEITVELTAKRKMGGKLSARIRLNVPKEGLVGIIKR